ncbi:MAG: hypothetical protein Q7T11_05735 [Deltaproteobacteria bacterium]|nr:hypothetical protein [Deltaproteobacteria bacterium]
MKNTEKIIPICILAGAFFHLAQYLVWERQPILPPDGWFDYSWHVIGLAGLGVAFWLVWKFVPGNIGMQSRIILIFSALQTGGEGLELAIGKLSALFLFLAGLALFAASLKTKGIDKSSYSSYN